jgi:hypothetical protein
VTGDITVTANFAINTHTLTYTAGLNGSIGGTSPQTIDDGSDGEPVIAVGDSGYTFLKWSDNSTDNPRQDIGVTGDISVTANFVINTFTLTYSAGLNGAIGGTTPQTVNYGSSGTIVTAIPNANYHFTDWSDGVLTASRQDVGVTGDISVTANFAINTYTLTYTAGSNGAIGGTSPQIVNSGSDGSPVTAIADTGYAFLKWSDNSTSNPRQDTGVTGDISVSAEFTDTRTISNPDPSIMLAQITGGYISIGGTDATATDTFTFNLNYVFDTGNAQISFPYGTVATETGGGTFDLTAFSTTDNTSEIQSELNNIAGAVNIGITGISLTFSNSYTVSISVGVGYEGQTLSVLYRSEGLTQWNSETTCLVASGLCTFQTNHATTFAARNDFAVNPPSSSSDNVISHSPPVCGDSKPTAIPDLFQINVSSSSAKLFFTHVPDSYKYYISFSTKPAAEEHGAEMILASENIQNVTINLLKPNATYYFKVRAGNGCMPGDWSSIMKVTTGRKGTTRMVPFYKYSPIKRLLKSLTAKK